MLYLYYKNKQNHFCLLRMSYRLKISFCFRNAFHLPARVCFFSDSLVQASTADGLALFAQRLIYSDPKETCCAWMAFQSALKLSSFLDGTLYSSFSVKIDQLQCFCPNLTKITIEINTSQALLFLKNHMQIYPILLLRVSRKLPGKSKTTGRYKVL